MTLGTLYGVGVGPGASDLVTLRAVSVLRSTPVLAFPKSAAFAPSTAFQIAQPHLPAAGQERLFLTFPMVHDPERLARAWAAALETVGERLERGLSVAFVTEGDPSLYSTFLYLWRGAKARWPALATEIVPAVSSLTAVPAVAGFPIAAGDQRIAILPAAHCGDELAAILDSFDTVVFMKIGMAMPRVIDAIAAAGLLDCAVYVSRATQKRQKVVRDLRSLRSERGDCFAMIVVAKGGAAGADTFLTKWVEP